MNAIALCTFRAAFAVLAGVAAVCQAQQRAGDYPRKPIRIVVGIAPGGGLDAVTRAAARTLSEQFGQSVIVDNRPGAGTVIAMDIAAQAAPDGYTLLSATDTLMLNGVLKRASYDVRKAFEPVVQMTSQMYMMLVPPSLPVKSVKELVAYAKSKPGTLSYGSQGLGTTGHLGMERFKQLAGVEIVHVPYKGAAPAMLDLLSGQIHLLFASTIASAPHVKSGKVRALAVTGESRIPAYPDLPTVAESGVPGFKLTNKYNLFAPAGTPRAIILAVNQAVSRGMNSPEMVKILAADGAQAAAPAPPEAFKELFAKEYAEVEKLVAALNLRLN